MNCLIDTNIILRLSQPQHPMASQSLNALATLRKRQGNLYLTPQNLIEFWRTCTRPLEQNGLGLTIEESDAELTQLETIFDILPDIPAIYLAWRKLVYRYAVKGVNVHDARLVAVMQVYSLSHILTFNTSDFIRYAEIQVIHPQEVINSESV